jgi:hypothetical protein
MRAGRLMYLVLGGIMYSKICKTNYRINFINIKVCRNTSFFRFVETGTGDDVTLKLSRSFLFPFKKLSKMP